MRLFVVDPEASEKIYLKSSATTRSELAREIGSYFELNGGFYIIDVVEAEVSDNTAPAMVAGGAVGLVGGVLGVIIGGAIGGFLGKQAKDTDQEQVNTFNQSAAI